MNAGIPTHDTLVYPVHVKIRIVNNFGKIIKYQIYWMRAKKFNGKCKHNNHSPQNIFAYVIKFVSKYTFLFKFQEYR